MSCSIPSTGIGELLPAGSSPRGLLKAQLVETEQGCGPRDQLWWEQRQNQQWNPQVSLSLLALFLPRASLFSSLQIQMVPGVSSLFFFLHGYFYPFVFRSLGLWVPVAAASACGCRQEGGLGGDSAAIRQMTQGLSTVHKAMLLVKPNHVSETGQGAISHKEMWGLGG